MLQAGFLALRQIKSIKKCLSYDSLRTLAVALILSRIDYSNTLLAGLPEKQLCRVQSLINTTARLITGTRKFDHITPVLKKLHWVKVRDRVVDKILDLRTQPIYTSLSPKCLILESVGLKLKAQVCGTACWKA